MTQLIFLSLLFVLKNANSLKRILGDPGAASRDNGIFMGETERVPEAFEIPPSDIFLANQRRGTAGRLSCLLTRGCFPHRTP